MPKNKNPADSMPNIQELKPPFNWKNKVRALLTGALLLLCSSSVFSHPTWDGCKGCHGKFEEDSYISSKDGSNWGTNLMDGHDSFAPGKCDACHKSGSEGEVFLNLSVDSSLSMGCVGCHGRVEDVNGNCSGLGGGSELHCGSGAGLRQHHETEVRSGTCNTCHSSDPTPVGEHVQPFNYGKSGVVIADACDADGTESRYGATGLDNDGDGLMDGNDTDCQVNTAPTQPGTLIASAITVDSATISWGASTDEDDDTISYLVEYRRDGDVPWTSAGSTNNVSHPLSGLDSAQSYDVRVTPTDGMDAGTARLATNLFQTDALNSPPTRPGTLIASAITVDSATISWRASTDADDDAISYLVEYRRDGDVPWTSAGSTNNVSHPLSGLDSAQYYDVRVTPTDAIDAGTARLATNLFQTDALNSPPTQPGTLSASSITENSATVGWGASTDADDDAISYLVEYRRDGYVLWNSAGSTNNISKSLNGLDPAQSYDVKVTPSDGEDDGPVRASLNLFRTLAIGEVFFRDGFEGLSEGSVCTETAQCASGLLCCYPCGIEGCVNRCTVPLEESCPLYP